MSHLRQVFYVSRVAPGLDDRVIRRILALSRRKNRMLDVTGCLTCTGGHFAQVLEGRDAAVAELLEVVAADPRHADFKIVLDRPLTLREYPLWSMAYLFNTELADDIEALFGQQVSSRKALQMIVRLKPDTVMGAL
ncbi:MAG: BLUF domain-containing protein [Rhizobacter sp.]